MFVICGEALFDLFGEPSSPESISFDGRIGGSPLNVAMGLTRLGQEAGFFGGISRDAFGEMLMQKLHREGISQDLIVRSDHLTTLSVVQKDDHGHPAYTFYGANAADRMIMPDDLPEFSEAPTVLHVGSYTALVEPVAGALKALIEREQNDTLVSFDPNIRPTVVPDMELWRENTEALMPLTDVIKVSDEDLGLILPDKSIDDIAQGWLGKGPGLIVVTRGADGANAYCGNRKINCHGVKVKVEDTVGAGDTFQAALLAGLVKLGVRNRTHLAELDDDRLIRLVEFAIKAAAITCSRRGADLPRLPELEKEWKALK
ncbi:carbohydrate kinase family protein [Roseibium sp.]|uniref:carbohydrate kinase family protein n=1 Tax=Roseibium sp. TaxID=1936156 RepID=UPI0039EFF789